MTAFYPSTEYRIDRNDCIHTVNSAWDAFALSNDTPELLSSSVIGRSIWDYIDGEAVRALYKDLIAQVRAGRQIDFDLRCDAPDLKRYLRMRISPGPEGEVRFETRIVKVETRPSEEILRPRETASERLEVICSWCKRIKTAPDEWHDAALAVRTLGLFADDDLPALSHSICGRCYDRVMSEGGNQD